MTPEEIQRIIELDKNWAERKKSELAQQSMQAEGEKHETPGMAELIREVGAESVVLLKNENQTLPVKPDQKIALFGRCQVDSFHVGYGSGGDVNPVRRVSILEGMEAEENLTLDEELVSLYKEFSKTNPVDNGIWGSWPFYYPEMPLEEIVVEEASNRDDIAVIVIGRAAGEERENELKPGSYYLTEEEEKMISLVCGKFNRVVLLLNIGNLMDLSWISKYPSIQSVALIWQLGQEMGYSVADVVSGRVNPAGHLTDTIARSYESYSSAKNFGNWDANTYEEGIFIGYRYFETKAEDEILYHFGHGLSYTNFSVRGERFSHTPGMTEVRASAKNLGMIPGKALMQVYCSQETPGSPLEKPKRILVSYGKTDLLSQNQSEEQAFTISDYQLASYDAKGETGHKSAYVLEAGTYRFYVGTSSAAADLEEVGSFVQEETYVVKQCEEVSTESVAERRMRILGRLPKAIYPTGDKGIKLTDVKAGNATLDDFIAQLTPYELSDLTRGEGPMSSEFGTPGNTGIFGGITEELRAKGIPPLNTSDGPSGIRLMRYCSLIPIGTALASTWDDHLVRRLFAKLAEELDYYKVDVLLAPGMNIHRNPLCGRNFEYYSEDPYLTGWIAAAAVDGIQSRGASACPKHFACNHQEVNRNRNSSDVDERTLREIYLRGFEMMVQISNPKNIMTSYNKVNGVWSHYNYDLVTTVLRGEWGYKGNVLTDWWMQMDESKEFPGIKDNAYRIRAGVDVLMPGGLTNEVKEYIHDDNIEASMEVTDGLTLGELQNVARHVLTFALDRM